MLKITKVRSNLHRKTGVSLNPIKIFLMTAFNPNYTYPSSISRLCFGVNLKINVFVTVLDFANFIIISSLFCFFNRMNDCEDN